MKHCKHLNDLGKITKPAKKTDGMGWYIEGCCQVGCIIIHHIEYCPFCGDKI